MPSQTQNRPQNQWKKPNEINGLQIMVDNEEGVCYSMNCRRNTVGITRIWRKEMSKVEMFDLHFQIPVSKMTVSAEGNFWNLPYFVQGGTFKHGKQECEAVISKGKIIIRTRQGRAELGETKQGNAKAPKVNVAEIF